MNFKKGAQVKIISGKDKGKTGEILEIVGGAEALKSWYKTHQLLITLILSKKFFWLKFK